MSKLTRIPFNRPFLTGRELENIANVMIDRRFSGDGPYSRYCEKFLEVRYKFGRVLLTTSCTDALEMAALLLDIQPGDEVILPSFTFPSTANAFALRGAKLMFADSLSNHPNVDPDAIADLITPKTKAIVVVHYSGMACDMNRISEIASSVTAPIVEDAAHAIDATYFGKPLGTFGALATLSFHETKNVHCGEGGMIAINSEKYLRRADIIREKGTNRTAFFRGEVEKYGWMDIGSSFLPGEMTAAFLAAQLESIEEIQAVRITKWNRYFNNLNAVLSQYNVQLPSLPEGASNNAHLFYLVCDARKVRNELIRYLDANNIQAVFHYQSLHASPYFHDKHDGRDLPNCDRFSDCLVRLPLFHELPDDYIDRICESVLNFFSGRNSG